MADYKSEHSGSKIDAVLNNNATTLANLKAITGSFDGQVVTSSGYAAYGDGGGGTWHWNSANLASLVAADSASGLYAAPTSDATGASGAWVRQFTGSLSVLWYGAKGDGATDDGDALRTALLAAETQELALDFGSRTYIVGYDDSRLLLPLTSNTTIIGDNCTLKLADNAGNGGGFGLLLLTVVDAVDVTIKGTFILDGNRANQDPADLPLEKGAIGLYVLSDEIAQVENLTVDTIIAKDWQKDGFYIGVNTSTNGPPKDTTIVYAKADNCGRNGVSITGADGLTIQTLVAKDTNGTSPETGVDIEPNNLLWGTEGIRIDSLHTHGNAQQGLWILGKGITQLNSVSIGYVNAYDNDGIGVSVQNCPNVKILSGDVHENGSVGVALQGGFNNIRLALDSYQNAGTGFYVDPSVACTRVDLSTCKSFNNGQSATGEGFDIRSAGGSIDDICLDNISAYDDQGTPTQRYGVKSNSATLTGFRGSSRSLSGNTTAALLLAADHDFESFSQTSTVASFSFGSIPANSSVHTQLAVANVLPGDKIVVSPVSWSNSASFSFSAHCATSGQVTIVVTNNTTGALTPTASVWYIYISR